jgi:hypothetical protein
MDILRDSFDFSGIHDKYIRDIKETCMIFEHISFAPDGADWKWLCIKGTMLGKPEFDYYVSKANS